MAGSRSWAIVVALAVAAVGCGDDGQDEETRAFCDTARSFEDQVQIDPDNPDVAEFERTADALEELAATAPQEIRNEITTAGQLVREFAELLATIDLSDPASFDDPEVQERLAAIQERDTALGPDLEAIGQYLEDECGIGGEEG